MRTRCILTAVLIWLVASLIPFRALHAEAVGSPEEDQAARLKEFAELEQKRGEIDAQLTDLKARMAERAAAAAASSAPPQPAPKPAESEQTDPKVVRWEYLPTFPRVIDPARALQTARDVLQAKHVGECVAGHTYQDTVSYLRGDCYSGNVDGKSVELCKQYLVDVPVERYAPPRYWNFSAKLLSEAPWNKFAGYDQSDTLREYRVIYSLKSMGSRGREFAAGLYYSADGSFLREESSDFYKQIFFCN